MQARYVVMALVCASVGCASSECDRLGVRDGKAWIVMDCEPGKVRASVSGNSAQGYFEFSCKESSERYSGRYFLGETNEDGALKRYSAVINDEDGCNWTKEDGGEDTCVSVDGASYPEDCDSSSDSYVVYY